MSKTRIQSVNELTMGAGNRNEGSTIKEMKRDRDSNMDNDNGIFNPQKACLGMINVLGCNAPPQNLI